MFRAGTEHPELLERHPTHFTQTPALNQTSISETSYAQQKSMEEHSRVSILKQHPHTIHNCLYRTQGSGHSLNSVLLQSKPLQHMETSGKETKGHIYICIKRQARSQLSSPQNKKMDGCESEQTCEYLCSRRQGTRQHRYFLLPVSVR